MIFNYHNKIFRSASNSENGEVSTETIFEYKQNGNIITAFYHGGAIVSGHLIALVDEKGCLDMRYHHLNSANEFKTGICKSTPEILPNGKIRLHENWQWTCDDCSKGTSIIEEA